MTLTWVACKARTGEVITDLPDLEVSSVSRLMGQYTSAEASLPLPTAPPEWERCTVEKGTFYVLVDDTDPDNPVGMWGGLVTLSKRTHGDRVSLSMATLEAYFDTRFVGDVTYTSIDQCAIVASLVTAYAADSLPIRVEYTPSSTTRTRTYLDVEDKSLYSVLTELSAVDGGPEWTIEWEQTLTPTVRWTPVIRIADRIGSAVTPGLNPAVVFDMPGGGVTEVEYVRDYTSGKGATDVVAVSTAVGDVRPASLHQVSIDDPDRLRTEFRFTPSTSITSVSTLTSHARQALEYMKNGAVSLSLSGVADLLPRLGSDWFMGDDVGYQVGGRIYDGSTYQTTGIWSSEWTATWGVEGLALVYPDGRDTVPAFPAGLSGTARAIGWNLTLGDMPIITPILVSTGA